MNFRRLLFIRSIIAMLVAAGSPASHAGSLWGKVSPQEWQQMQPIFFPDANAAVLIDCCTLTVSLDNIEVQRFVRMKLFNKKGAEDIGTVEIYYDKDDAFKDFKAETISPNGTTTKVDGKDVHIKTDGDARYKTFTFPAMDSGCIVEYSYRDVNERYAFMDPWDFQTDIFTLKSSFTLILGPGFTYVTAFANVPATDRAGTHEDLMIPGQFTLKNRAFTWTRTNLLPLKSEPYIGAKSDYMSSLHNQLVSYEGVNHTENFIKGWPDLGEKFQAIIDDRMSGGDLDKILAEILPGATNPVEKAKKIYDWVSSSIQYAPDPNNHYFTNDNIGKLLQSRSGTGEEKNLLLCALLKKAGIQSWPVMISTRDHHRFNPEVYQMQQFDYIIAFAQFDSSIIYMDAVSKYCPFGLLPPNKLADGGCLIDGKNSQLVKILRNEPKSYRLDLTDVNIDSAGVAQCTTSCSFSGYFAPSMGELHEASTPEDFLKKNFLDQIDPSAAIVSNEFEIDSLSRCKLNAVYTLKNLVRQLDSNLVLKPISFRFRENPFTAEKRYYPIDFKFAQTYHNIMVVRSDRTIKAATLPPDVDLTVDGAHYVRISQLTDGVVRVESKLTLTRDVYPQGEYAEVKKLFETIERAQQDEFVLTTGI